MDGAVNPNGQKITVVQVVLKFDPTKLNAVSSTANPNAPLSLRLPIKRIFELFEREFYDFEALKV